MTIAVMNMMNKMIKGILQQHINIFPMEHCCRLWALRLDPALHGQSKGSQVLIGDLYVKYP